MINVKWKQRGGKRIRNGFTNQGCSGNYFRDTWDLMTQGQGSLSGIGNGHRGIKVYGQEIQGEAKDA